MTTQELQTIKVAAKEGMMHLSKVNGVHTTKLEEDVAEAIMFAIKKYDELKNQKSD